MDLETGSPPKRQAPLLPRVVVAALEVAVCTDTLPLFLRGFAFYKLLKIWAAARHSDLESLSPSSLSISQGGLEGRLDRTKTSGPGKRVRFLPIFVAKDAFFLRPDWQTMGMSLWKAEEMNFERDFFLPLPAADFSGCRRGMASYSHVVSLSKQLWRCLRFPTLSEGQWVFSDTFLFASPDAVSFWTAHSERNWLVSILAAAGVPHEQREFIGRWRACSSSEEYVRSARFIVRSLQLKALSALGVDPLLRSLGMDELVEHLRNQCGFCNEELVELRDRCAQCVQQFPFHSFAVPTCNQPAAEAGAGPMPEVAPAEELDSAEPFFIAIVGHRRLRRLHRSGGCPAAPRELREVEYLQSLEGAVYDFACKHCWRGGAEPGESSESPSSSSEPSSSDSSATEC